MTSLPCFATAAVVNHVKSRQRKAVCCVMGGAVAPEGQTTSSWQDAAVARHNGTEAPHAGSYYVSRRPRAPFFEGWYLRVVLPNSMRSFAFMFSIESEGPGTMQLLDDRDNLHMMRTEPHAYSRFFGEKRSLSIGHWGYTTTTAGDPRELTSKEFEAAVLQGYQLSSTGTHGRFSGGDKLVQWGFEYSPVLTWGERGAQSRCTATWLSRLPMFDPGYQVLMAHGVASSGYIRVDGKEVDVSGAAVYCEKNWGSSFPKRWWWVQANAFPSEPDLSVTALGSTRRICWFEEVIGIIAIHFRGLFFEFSNWNCESLDWDVDVWGSWKASAVGMTGHTAELIARTSELPVKVLGPSPNGMVYNVQDNARGVLLLTIRDPGGKTILDTVECRTAQVEVGGGPWDETWRATVRKMPQPLRGAVNMFHRPKVQTSP